MSGVSEAIGTFFEERLLRSLPLVQDYRDVENAPDFRWEPVWIEAKVAFDAADYGIQPKTYQFSMHGDFAPMIYACGYHDFDHATRRLKQKTPRGRLAHLNRHAAVNRVFLVSSVVIERMWEKDAKQSAKESLAYCPLAANDFRRIVNDGPVRRNGTIFNAREYYKLPKCAYQDARQDAQPIGFILTMPDFELLSDALESIVLEELFSQSLSRV